MSDLLLHLSMSRSRDNRVTGTADGVYLSVGKSPMDFFLVLRSRWFIVLFVWIAVWIGNLRGLSRYLFSQITTLTGTGTL